jgi:hypothetical protein
MEAVGMARIVDNLFSNYLCYIYEHVGDDDSSMKKVLRHSWQDQVDVGVLLKVPYYKNGEKKNKTTDS